MPEKGKVKWFSNVKGFGFLQKEGDAQDIFIHYSSIQGEGYKTLKDAEEVTFDIVQGPKGPQAANVVRNKKPAAAQTPGAPKEAAGKK
ncbi:MAG TPA: cold shock domain-containing protein [bacterium]|nr:cold shock domain-containing protein [bacterium]